MKSISILILGLLLGGCSSMGSVSSSIVRDVTATAPAFCSALSPDSPEDKAKVQKARVEVFSQIPAGTDKDKAQQAVDAAGFSLELTCNALKAIEASRASQAAQPVK